MPSRIMAPHRTRFSIIRDTLRKCFTLLLLKFFCGEIQNWIRTRLSRRSLSRSACLIVTAGLESVSLGVRFRSCRTALKGVLAHFRCRLDELAMLGFVSQPIDIVQR